MCAASFALFAPAVVLGYLRVRIGRLAPSIVAHSTFNGLVLMPFLIPSFR